MEKFKERNENCPKNDENIKILPVVLLGIVFLIIFYCCGTNDNKKEELQTRLVELQRRLGQSEQDREELQTRLGELQKRSENFSKNHQIIIILLGIITAILSLFIIILCKCCIENKNKKVELQRRLGQSEWDRVELQRRLGQGEQDRVKLQTRLGQSEQDREELQTSLVKLQTRLGQSEQDREELQTSLVELQRRLGHSIQDRVELQRRLGQSEQDREELQTRLDKREATFKSAWKKALLHADWKKEEFKAINVTLNAASAHPALLLSEDGKQVTWKETCQDLPSFTQRFVSLPCALGQQDISSGRFYWEVEVGDKPSWDLGICRYNVKKKGRVTMSPQNGFWAIRLCDGEYWALTSPETLLTLRERPLCVGIFLDYEAGDVSFCNMTDGSHIFTFPQVTFNGVLRPLFVLWSSGSGPLTIVHVEEKM